MKSLGIEYFHENLRGEEQDRKDRAKGSYNNINSKKIKNRVDEMLTGTSPNSCLSYETFSTITII
jgi:murein tripeptide amidase MpaA